VSTASIAYSMQFVSSQLSWAQEMRGYEDALQTFHKARSALRDIRGSGAGAAECAAFRHTILDALGREALKENESWLRTHRDRPLEPLPPT
jgi:hypothetical protein